MRTVLISILRAAGNSGNIWLSAHVCGITR